MVRLINFLLERFMAFRNSSEVAKVDNFTKLNNNSDGIINGGVLKRV